MPPEKKNQTVIEQLDGVRRYNRMSVEELCARAGMATRTYYRRLQNPDGLTVGEIRAIRKAMRLKEGVPV